MSKEIFTNKNGKSGGITIDGRLMGEAVSMDYGLAVALQNQMAYTLYDLTVTPTGPGDYFCKIANTHPLGYKLVISGLLINDAAAESIALATGVNFVSAGTHAEIEPINRFVGSPKLASSYGQFESDVDIQGFVGNIFKYITVGVATDYTLPLSKAVAVLDVNRCFVLQAITGTTAIRYSVDFYWAVPGVTDAKA
jgi:hypothetical protein